LDQVELLKRFYFSRAFEDLNNYDAHYYDDDYQLILHKFEEELSNSTINLSGAPAAAS
jgi:hypothetical protein